LEARKLSLLVLSAALVGALAYWLRPPHESTTEARRDAQPSPPTPNPLSAEQPAAAAAASVRAPAVEPLAATPQMQQPALRYRLVDDRTGEPAAHFEVTLEPGAVAVTSDAKGELVFANVPSNGAELVLTENQRNLPARLAPRAAPVEQLVARVKLPARADPSEVLDVRIPVGPTYRLALALPNGLELRQLSFELVCDDPSQRFDLATTKLRDPAQPWLRFHPTARLLRGAAPWRVQAHSADGLWLASAPVPSNVGVQREVVALAFEARARLVGTVRDSSGAPLEGDYVRIEREGAQVSDPANYPLLGHVGDGGEYQIPCATPGAYSVRLEREGYLPFQGAVTLPASQSTHFDIVLDKPAAAESGRILVRIESSSGTFAGPLYPYLRLADQKTAARRGELRWNDENGRRVGSIVYDDVPFGEYDAGLQASGFVVLEPRVQRVRPGEPEISFRVRDDVWLLAPLEVRAFDESGAPLEDYHAALTVVESWGDATDRATEDQGRARFAAAPVGVRGRLKVTRTGWQPSWSEVELDAAQRELRVTLKPGWGIEVNVRGSDGAALEGARVYFDDELAGATDVKGELFVARAATPQRARVEYRDWKPTANSRLDAEGRFRNFEPWLVVELAPAQ
jgi:hypothetical protein